jgi:hypothetical protein
VSGGHCEIVCEVVDVLEIIWRGLGIITGTCHLLGSKLSWMAAIAQSGRVASSLYFAMLFKSLIPEFPATRLSQEVLTSIPRGVTKPIL